MNAKLMERKAGPAMRDVYCETMLEMMREDDRIVELEADLSGAMNTRVIRDAFPERFVNCGIMEAHMAGLACGMSVNGMIPFAHSFATFLSRRVADQVFIPFTVGGGIRTVEDFKAILREGADKISVNSAAINEPELISRAADKFGSQCVVLAIDARRREDGGWNIYKNGGRIDTGLDAVEWAIRAEKLGAGEILLTSMDADGTKAGYDLTLTRIIADAVHIPVIASGGAGTKEHFYEALTEGHADAALAASLFHYKELTIREVKDYLAERNVPVRREGER